MQYFRMQYMLLSSSGVSWLCSISVRMQFSRMQYILQSQLTPDEVVRRQLALHPDVSYLYILTPEERVERMRTDREESRKNFFLIFLIFF